MDENIKRTSINSGHSHLIKVDELGNGVAEYYHNINDRNLKHKHVVINWVIQNDQDDCFPDCKGEYGLDGVGPHTHIIGETAMEELKSNPVIKKTKVKKRNKSTVTKQKTELRNQWPFSYKNGMKIDKDIKVDEV